MQLKNRRKELRTFAESVGICTSCLFYTAQENKRRCKRCIDTARVQARKYRTDPTRCSKCGQKNDRIETRKTCSKCYTYNKRAKQSQHA